MKAVGIIAEYNPFHNGHKINIEKAKEKSGAECVISVMSGSFVQRGEPAAFSKHARAAAAVKCGADLVIELPSYFALKSAGGFALGGTGILSAAGVQYIAFGAECDNIELLKETSEFLLKESSTFKKLLQAKLKEGTSFAMARAAAINEISPLSADILRSPNNILACEYMAAIKKTGSSAMPLAIKRVGSMHDSEIPDKNFASASFIRREMQRGNDISSFIPLNPAENPVFIEDFETLILYALKSSDLDTIRQIPDTSDGLAERLFASHAKSLSALLLEIKSKRFAMSRIKRVLMNILIKNNLPKNLAPSYLRVLALNDKGAAYLKGIKTSCPLPIITKPAAYKAEDAIFELETRASEIRSLISGNKHDIKTSPIKV